MCHGIFYTLGFSSEPNKYHCPYGIYILFGGLQINKQNMGGCQIAITSLRKNEVKSLVEKAGLLFQTGLSSESSMKNAMFK